MEWSPGDSPLLTLDETMTILRVSRSTMYRLVGQGELPGYKVAKRWVFERRDLEEFLARRRATGRQKEVIVYG